MSQQKSFPMIIGTTIKIVKATNPLLNNIYGRVIDETKNTFLIVTEKGEKRIIKRAVTITLNGVAIEGNQLLGRIEERLSQKNQNKIKQKNESE